MLAVAKSFGCETVKRAPYYASNEVSMSDVYKNIDKNCDCDVIVYINVTNPPIKDETTIKVIEEYKKNIDRYDSLNSAHLIKEFVFRDNRPINYDLCRQLRSQNLPNIYALNFAINIIFREDMIEYKNVVAVHRKFMELTR